MLFTIERVVTVWKGGWRTRLLAATLFPELVFAAFLDVVYVKGVLDITLGRQASWKHVDHAAPADGPSARGGATDRQSVPLQLVRRQPRQARGRSLGVVRPSPATPPLRVRVARRATVPIRRRGTPPRTRVGRGR
jgi:hypothetical protein